MNKESFFVKQLKKIMLEKGFTQKELAKKLNVTEAFVSAYCNGKRSPKPATLYKFAKDLGVKPDFFYNDKQKIFKNSIVDDKNFNNVINTDLKDMKIQLQDHEIRLLKLENKLLRDKII
ncbi:helix-turn-helix domain-containing protein [Candidatus Ruminimicrobium bovinum]|uniref:helix-turn-helix domain-containing protein n=1 Tax=Candidatus Ruminimicrobium bovinum TaxID=3242779 RepID=UPI0039B91D6F